MNILRQWRRGFDNAFFLKLSADDGTKKILQIKLELVYFQNTLHSTLLFPTLLIILQKRWATRMIIVN